MAETEKPDKAAKTAKKAARAQKAVSVAATVNPELRAAKAAAGAKVAASQSTAKAGARGAKTGAQGARKLTANQKQRLAQQGAAKAAAKKAAPAKSQSAKSQPSTKQPPAQRALSSGKKAATTRVQHAKESHRKTSSAVEGKYRRDKVAGLAEIHPKVRMLAAEYMAAMVMAIVFLFLPDKEYHDKMTRYFIQITGISGIFFVLALGSSSEKVARYAIPFGLLIDISMLMYLFKKGAGDTITTDLGGTPASVQTAEEKARKAAYAEPHQPNEPFYVAPGIPIQGPQL